MTRCIYFSSLLEVAHHTIHKVAATYISPPLSFMLVPWYRHVFSFLFFSFLPFYSTTWQVPHGFKEWWLKGHFIYVSSTGLIHVQLSPQSDPISSTILGPTFSHVKWWGPIIGLDILVGKLLWRELTFYGPMVKMFIIQWWAQSGPCWEVGPRKNSSRFLQAGLMVWRQNCAT
jgi:hypothetical protein